MKYKVPDEYNIIIQAQDIFEKIKSDEIWAFHVGEPLNSASK